MKGARRKDEREKWEVGWLVSRFGIKKKIRQKEKGKLVWLVGQLLGELVC